MIDASGFPLGGKSAQLSLSEKNDSLLESSGTIALVNLSKAPSVMDLPVAYGLTYKHGNENNPATKFAVTDNGELIFGITGGLWLGNYSLTNQFGIGSIVEATKSKAWWFRLSSTVCIISNAACFGWVGDTRLFRDDTDVLALRNAAAANSFRIYNTWTDASNYERFAIDWKTTSNVCLLRTSAAGTGTLRGMSIQQATGALSFYGATPVTQPASADQAAVVLGNADSEISGLTISATYDQTEVQALRDKCEELADDVRALSTLVHGLRTALVNLGAIKGAV